MRTNDYMEGNIPRAEQAAQWLVRLEALGEMPISPEELQAWDDWAANDENRAAFDELAAVRHQLKSIRQLAWPSAEELRGDGASVRGAIENPLERPSREIGVATLSHLRWRRRSLSFAVAASMAIVVGLIFLLSRPSQWRAPAAVVLAQTQETKTEEHRNFTLPDGSRVVLGGASALSIQYTKQQRIVILKKGQARFQVARNFARPFKVVAGNGAITALGTTFNVRRSGERVVVMVTEGLVEVAPASSVQRGSTRGLSSANAARWLPVRLAQNQMMSYETKGQVSAVEKLDSNAMTVWNRGTLVYRRRPLSDIIEEVSLYWPREVTLGPGVGNLKFTGTVGESDIPAWIRGLPDIFPVEIRESDAGHVVIQLREPKP